MVIWTKAGCSDTATISNRVSENPEILAPNIIQTNSKSGNDKFYLWSESQEVVLVKNLTIYERWGEKVFLRENFPINQPEYGWNGEFRGSPAIQGVYVWVAEVLLKNNKTIRLYGDVTVIR
ncbi:MAG: gliding motility-associated C-terminal domain-containing protein [Saprospiraceae bacterium]|nr:gliding motility-associated C-terminal domain-containing protein [Saprospiraceae bacterium]